MRPELQELWRSRGASQIANFVWQAEEFSKAVTIFKTSDEALRPIIDQLKATSAAAMQVIPDGRERGMRASSHVLQSRTY